MPALYLTEEDVRSSVTMEDAIVAVEQSFRRLAAGTAVNQDRQRLRTENVMLHQLAGVDRSINRIGWKIYTTTREQARFLVGIYDGESGELLTLIEADYLGQLRTGAASAVATRYLANESATRLGIIGTGLQARTQAAGICAVRDINEVIVFGRDAERRQQFADQLQQDLKVSVRPVDNVQELVRQSEILVTATTSKTPVFSLEDLQPGTHINAIGSNFYRKTELDPATIERADFVCCDEKSQCQIEAGVLITACANGLADWNSIHELATVITEETGRKADTDITLFKSVGLGIQDVVFGSLILERGLAQGKGERLPF